MNAKTAPSDDPHIPLLHGTDDGVRALNAALNAFIIMPANEEDWFRFSHDRYLTYTIANSDTGPLIPSNRLLIWPGRIEVA